MAMVALTCEHCGGSYRRRGDRIGAHSFCSRSCYNNSGNRRGPRPKPVILACAGCAAMVVRRPSEVKGNVWCSSDCYNEHRGAPDQVCSHCGDTYNRPPATRSHGTDKNYCSWTCYTADPDKPTNRGCKFSDSSRQRMRDAARTRRTDGYRARRKPPQPCAQCGTMFKAHGKGTGRPRHCSLNCWYDAVRADPSLNGRYIDGTTIIPDGRLWFSNREAVLRRDGNTCTRCGARLRSKLMHVHHIVPLREFTPGQDAAHALDNLTTLCAYCHPAVEWATHRRTA